MAKMIFLNLPVRDLAAATRFYEAIGCVKNEQYSDHQTSSMMWSDTITFHLMTHAYYGTFTSKPITDGHQSSAMLIALTLDNREDVDAIVDAAQSAGGRADVREPQDMGFMYLRTFEDPDGNLFEPVWMNPEAMMGEQDGQ